ncbi:hypothetical protein SAMD00019534_105470 [Acytostelium subglobosum LB1]|uniref:hypothetical protein n=1 Tax=Acytostelium subglobosum LB1 TaxID=1410327 RepID=UPI000644D29D|nr:hypothetical protein SAMD00019534_105470 [Acytostelium subglobosum LB1]GAM27372.1 hypothetical protein SAMD00019534_105470 [Acytostelium subglobosum LB1]|eukprot:XP_012749839.1 hypothetical protein SAMD00019534_105470 [Acytostelium subglobosum LB1]
MCRRISLATLVIILFSFIADTHAAWNALTVPDYQASTCPLNLYYVVVYNTTEANPTFPVTSNTNALSIQSPTLVGRDGDKFLVVSRASSGTRGLTGETMTYVAQSQQFTTVNTCDPPTSQVTLSTPVYNYITSKATSYFNIQPNSVFRFTCSSTNPQVQCLVTLVQPDLGLYKVEFSLFVIKQAGTTSTYFDSATITIAANGYNYFNGLVKGIGKLTTQSPSITIVPYYYQPPQSSTVHHSFGMTGLELGKGLVGSSNSQTSSGSITYASNSQPLVGNLTSAIFYGRSTYSTPNTTLYINYVDGTNTIHTDQVATLIYTPKDTSAALSSLSLETSVLDLPSNFQLGKVEILSALDHSFTITTSGQTVYPNPPLPYGLANGTFASANYAMDYFFAQQFTGNTINTLSYSGSTSNKQSNNVFKAISTADQLMPFMWDVTITPIGTYTYVVTITFKDDLSGMMKAVLSPQCTLTSADLVEGSVTNGVMSRVCIFLSTLPQSLSIIDYSSNKVNIPVHTPYRGAPLVQEFLLMPSVPSIVNWSPSDITAISFQNTTSDVSTGPSNNVLYFNVRNAQTSLRPRIALLFDQMSESSLTLDNTFEGAWDYVRQMYAVPFTIPARVFTTFLPYAILSNVGSITWQHLYGVYGAQSQATVTSKNADMMPPLIAKVSTSTETNSVNAWLITLEDDVNGFKNGYINVTSNLDPLGLRLDFTATANLVSGSTYRVVLPAKPNCVTQTYTISGISLTDNSGYTSATNNPGLFDPLMHIGQDPSVYNPSMTITCPTAPETLPPTLDSFTMTPTTMNVRGFQRTVSFALTVSDTGGSGVSNIHAPVIYLSTLNGETISSTAIEQQRVGNSVKYAATINVPYGFGLGMPYIYASVYGIMDNSFNLRGYPTTELSALFSSVISIVDTELTPPVIESNDPISVLGGDLTIYGRSFGSNLNGNPSLTGNVLSNNSQSVIGTYSQSMSVHVVAVFKLPSNYNTFRFQVFNPFPSNIITIIPYVPELPPSDYECSTSNCIFGSCVDNLCVCDALHTGANCTSEISNTTRPDGNSTEPATNPGSGSSTSRIEIHSIREVSSTGELVHEYKIANWTFFNYTTNDENHFVYSAPLPGRTTTVNVTIQFFVSSAIVHFAGESLYMSPGATKFSVKFDTYSFASSVNVLQVLFGVSFTDNGPICGSSGSEAEKDSVQMTLNGRVLSGSFHPNGEVDGRVVRVNNEVLNATKDASTVQALMATSLPFFTDYAALDPSWTILVETKGSGCGNSGLTKMQKVGIIVGSIAFMTCVVIAVVYTIWRNKLSIKKKKEMDNRLNTFQ